MYPARPAVMVSGNFMVVYPFDSALRLTNEASASNGK
jgi:hypothetical protein